MVPTLKRPNTFLFILLLAPFIKPVLVDEYPALDALYFVWKLLSLVFLAIGLLPEYFHHHPRKMIIGLLGLLLFWVIYCINCFASGTAVISTLTAALSAMLCFLLVSYETRIGNGWILLRSMSLLFTALILAHAISVVVLPVAPQTVFLLGMDNYSAFFIYPMLSVILFYQSLRFGRLRIHSWALILLVVFIYVYTASYTAAAAGLLFLACLFLYPSWRKLPKVRGIRWLVPLLLLLLVLIVEFEIQNLLSHFLNATSKGITLNSRTIIWDYALTLIAQKPLFGHGEFSAEQIAEYILYGTTHAHNLLLELVLRAGIIGAIGYVVYLCSFVSTFQGRRTNTRHNYLLLSSLLCQLILSFMDFYPSITVFYLFMAVLYFQERFTPPERRKSLL